MNSAVLEDYIKATYEIEREHGRVTTTELAARLEVTPASVTGMVKKLVEHELVSHVPYHGIELTEKGVNAALEVIRRHRLLELYLVRALKFSWDEVHKEAEQLEHVVSEELARRIDEYLGHPTVDPHGAPIPGGNNSPGDTDRVRLSELEAGDVAVITEVDDRDAEFLRHVGGMGLFPGKHIRVVETESYDCLCTVRVHHETHVLGKTVAERIFVRDIRRRRR